MSATATILRLVLARARRRPGRWLLTALGIAIATAFAGAVVAEATIAGDQAARRVLRGLTALERSLTVTAPPVVTEDVQRRVHAMLRELGLRSTTQVALLSAVRLDGMIVRPAAIDPLSDWTSGSAAAPGRCRRVSCPVLLAGGSVGSRRTFTAAGIRLPIVGRTRLRSAAPLGFSPTEPADQPPVLLSADPAGLESLGGLSGVYRSHSWLTLLPLGDAHAWQLRALERRLRLAQASLLAGDPELGVEAPFAALDAARARAAAAPRSLLLAGGGAAAALMLFVVLAVGGLRRDVHAELERLLRAGARARDCGVFVVAESALLCGAALAAGAALALVAAVVLALAADAPVGAVLVHSLLRPVSVATLVLAWPLATGLVVAMLLVRGTRVADALALAATAALLLALTRTSSSDDPLPALLAPLACLAAGVLVFRAAAVALRGAERVLRPGPVQVRLAVVGLARSPTGPALAIAFIAVTVALGGFALAYRATLVRGTVDQAAQRVPLDAIVAAGTDFATPLDLVPLSRWRAIAGGPLAPVRRTDASFVSGPSSVTVPALGVPAAALVHLQGWRPGNASAPPRALARRLAAPGLARVAGPSVPAGAGRIFLRATSPNLAVTITADLRAPDGSVRRVVLGQTRRGQRTLSARLPAPSAGRELEALELAEPVGLESTNGHQNAENPAARTNFASTIRLGPLWAVTSAGADRPLAGLGSWVGVGAVATRSAEGRVATLRFTETGETGVLRPPQPTDRRPLPVLVDPTIAAAAGSSGRLALTVDGVPVSARVVGSVRRFPTVPAATPSFVVADEAALAAALDASLPGQGRANELWISTSDVTRLRTALRRAPLSQLAVTYRSDLQQGLRSVPVARASLGTWMAAAIVAALLAVLGLLVTMLGPARDENAEQDLVDQGLGPNAARQELRLRLLVSGAVGVLAGLAIAVLLTRLAVAAVRAGGSVQIPDPPLVAVAPWGALALWGLAALAALSCAAWGGARVVASRRGT